MLLDGRDVPLETAIVRGLVRTSALAAHTAASDPRGMGHLLPGDVSSCCYHPNQIRAPNRDSLLGYSDGIPEPL